MPHLMHDEFRGLARQRWGKVVRGYVEKEANLEKYRMTDSIHQGRDRYFMTIDSWIQDGNPTGAEDEFAPQMTAEAPPTLNGKPLEE